MNEFNPTGHDDYRPSEIAARVESLGVQKATMAAPQLLTLAVLAGVFIGLGALAYSVTMTGVDPSFGPARVLGGLVFSLGLILVIVGGAELFTGNALLVMAWVDRRITTSALLRNWSIVYVGNLIGSLALVACVWGAGLLHGPLGATMMTFAANKVALPLGVAFFRGLLCNVLVCLAVWLTLAARSVTGKIAAIVFPVTAFVAIGLEHSVANMFLVPAGWLAGADVTLGSFAFNLAVVTLGNVVGGAGGVALTYWLAYAPTRAP